MPEEEGERAIFVVKKWGLAVMAEIPGSGGGLEMRRPTLSGGNRRRSNRKTRRGEAGDVWSLGSGGAQVHGAGLSTGCKRTLGDGRCGGMGMGHGGGMRVGRGGGMRGGTGLGEKVRKLGVGRSGCFLLFVQVISGAPPPPLYRRDVIRILL